MTKPAAAHDHPDGTRTYPIPTRDTGEIVDLPSITRIIAVTDPKHLCDWNLKMVTLGAAHREDLQVQIAAANLLPAGKPRNAALRELMIAAHEAGQLVEKGHLPADRGTGYHTLTERLDELVAPGSVRTVDELGLPRPIAEIANAYVDAMRGVQVVASETTVVSFTHGYAGTLDRLVRFEPLDAWSAAFDEFDLAKGTFGFDNKFGTQMHPTFALQLAAIVNAEYIYDAATAALSPLPEDLRTDVGFVFAPQHGLVPVDLTDGWDAFLAALTIHRFNARHPLRPALPRSRASTAAPPEDAFAGLPDDEGQARPDRAAKREWLIERVQALAAKHGGLDAVASRWPTDVPTFKAAPEHTAEQLGAIERAVTDAEAEAGAPFPEHDDPTDQSLIKVAHDDPRVVALIHVRRGLPRDLVCKVDEARARAGVPTSLYRHTEETLAVDERIVADAVAEAATRAQRVIDALVVAAERGVTTEALYAAIGAEPGVALDFEAAASIDELADAVTAGLIVERDGHLVVDQPVMLLVHYGRDRRRVLAAGKAAALARGLEPPKDSDAVMADPIIAAAIYAF